MSVHAKENWRSVQGPEPPPVTTATKPFTLNKSAAFVEDILFLISNLDLEYCSPKSHWQLSSLYTLSTQGADAFKRVMLL